MHRHTLSLVAAATFVASTEARELTLDPIVVSASKTEQTLRSVSANTDVISADEIAERRYATLAEALNSLAGVGVVSNGGLGKSTALYLRGFDSKRTLVLIDGIRYNDNTSMDGASFEHLMLGDIERIEVIKGAQSGIWGSDASAGVVNIITRKTAPGTEAKALYEQGSFGTKKYGGSFGYGNDTLDLRLDARKIVSDGFTSYARRYTDIERYEDDGYENRTLGLNVGYRFDGANAIRFAHTDIDVYTEYDSTNGDSAANYRKNERLSRLSYENRFGDALTTLYANRSTFERDYSTGTTYNGRVGEYGAHSRIGYRENDFIVIGGDYKTFEHLNRLNREYDNRAVFITNTNILATGTVVTESLRRDVFDVFSDKTTGKIGFKHPWGEEGYVSANYGTAYNVPTLYQLYDPTYGNTALKPEETRSCDLTVGYSGISLTYFESRIKEMIEYDFTSSAYGNVEGTSRIRGIEAAFRQELGNGALVSLGYTRLDAQNQRGESLRRRAKENLKFGLDYYGIPKAHVGLSGEYVGSRYDSDNDRGAQTGKYTVASLVADYACTKHLKIYAKVDNITDKYYQSVNNYASSPRAWYAGIEVSF
ncbi:MAG: TonB-dependent receptor [Campylobacterota bacterium]